MSSTTESQIKYAGDGVQVLFTFPFTYLQPTDIYVSLYNETERRWDDTTEWTFANATTIQFTTAPPTATGEVTDNIRIQRRTSIDPLVAQFNPGSAIRASDLNDDFEQLQLAIIDNSNIITNTDAGVTSIIAGEGISVDQAVGNVTITNTKPSDVLSVNGQTGVVALDINDLTDVVTEGAGHVPTDGQALIWDAGMNHWMPGTVSVPGGGDIAYKGLIDFTGSAPSNPLEGDLWINTTEGVAGSTWTGIAGDAVTVGERAIYNGSIWQLAPVQPNNVSSVNSLTGDVVIGVEQLSDFAYYPASEQVTLLGPCVGDAGSFSGTEYTSGANPKLYFVWPKTNTQVYDVLSQLSAGDPVTVCYYSSVGTVYTELKTTLATLGNNGGTVASWLVQFNDSVPGAVLGDYPVVFKSPLITNGQLPITTGQALIYDQTTEKWRPEDIAAELNISSLPTLP